MSNERIGLDQLEKEIANLQDMHFDTRLDERVANAYMFNRILNELARCYQLLDELEERPLDDEVENYPEPDERIPPNTTRAGADWPSGPRM